MDESATEGKKSGGLKFDMTINVGHMVGLFTAICVIVGGVFGIYIDQQSKFNTLNSTIDKNYSEERLKLVSIEQKINQIEYRVSASDTAIGVLKTDQRTTDGQINDALKELNKLVISLQISQATANAAKPSR